MGDRPVTIAMALIVFCEAWLWIGLLVGLWFIAFAIDRVDPAARGAYLFRPLLLPGAALLWPLVLWRYRRLSRQSLSEAI